METIHFEGDNPQPRFGHTICEIAPNKIALFGGAVGDTGKYMITGDVYTGDVIQKKWKIIESCGSVPINRAAHQALAIELNQMIIFGGAVGGGGLADDNLFIFELRDDTGTWVIIPVIGTTPGRRYGHSMVLIKPYLIVFGGNTGQEPVNDVWSFNLQKSPYQWQKLDFTQALPIVRVYHSAALCNSGPANGIMVAFGGRTNDQTALNDTWGLRKHRDGRWDWVKAPYKNQNEIPEPRYQHSTLFLGTLMLVIGSRSNQVGDFIPFEIYDTETSEWYKFQSIMRFRHSSWLVDQYLSYLLSINQQNCMSIPNYKQVRLANQAFVALIYDPEEDISNQVKKVPIDKLQDEHRKIQPQFQDPDSQHKSQFVDQMLAPFLQNLLLPKDYQSVAPNTNLLTGIRKDSIIKLCDEVQRILEKEPILLRLRRPIKIYGNLNCQYLDLMRFFDHFKAPYDNLYYGDIDSQDYLFLGDYIDRGTRSLEIILLLFTLKVKYGDQIHLLRGHHEDPKINKIYGFADECFSKYSEDIFDPNRIYQRINRVFQYMPLAAIIEDEIFCVHGGIGQTMRMINEIELIQKPLQIIHNPVTYKQKIALDLLWSDPCINEDELENQQNTERDLFKIILQLDLVIIESTNSFKKIIQI